MQKTSFFRLYILENDILSEVELMQPKKQLFLSYFCAIPHIDRVVQTPLQALKHSQHLEKNLTT